jgi:hypothetical protein
VDAFVFVLEVEVMAAAAGGGELPFDDIDEAGGTLVRVAVAGQFEEQLQLVVYSTMISLIVQLHRCFSNHLFGYRPIYANESITT